MHVRVHIVFISFSLPSSSLSLSLTWLQSVFKWSLPVSLLLISSILCISFNPSVNEVVHNELTEHRHSKSMISVEKEREREREYVLQYVQHVL